MRFPDDGFDDEDDLFGDRPLDEGGDLEEAGPPSDPILEGAIYLAQEAGDDDAAAALLETLDARRQLFARVDRFLGREPADAGSEAGR